MCVCVCVGVCVCVCAGGGGHGRECMMGGGYHYEDIFRSQSDMVMVRH